MESAQAAYAAAVTETETANAAVTTGTAAYKAAVLAGGDGSTESAAIIAAEQAARFAAERETLLQSAVTTAQEAVVTAERQSWAPTWESGAAARVEAAKLHEQARALEQEARDKLVSGNALLQTAREHGYSRDLPDFEEPHFSRRLPLGTSAEEAVKWTVS